jgi:hypothetical protein
MKLRLKDQMEAIMEFQKTGKREKKKINTKHILFIMSGAFNNNTDPVLIGKYGADIWNGNLDEVRLSNSARSGGWIATEYNTTNSPSTFASIGPEEYYFCSGTGGPYYVQSRSASFGSVSQAQIANWFGRT